MQTTNDRQQRGELIAKARRNLKRINKLTYRVKSQTNGKYYHIKTTNIGNVTPAEKCGIKVEGDNKWVTLIQNAKREEQIE